ncbi:uncharacterized protein LOC135221229 [Macrobrachium nipponense]|uniref:uncharacterized protein LOC135221229 n=1 Tax=Macrobrachium nipponense TaxID=159736 RepID=UPI0030C87CE5
MASRIPHHSAHPFLDPHSPWLPRIHLRHPSQFPSLASQGSLAHFPHSPLASKITPPSPLLIHFRPCPQGSTSPIIPISLVLPRIHLDLLPIIPHWNFQGIRPPSHHSPPPPHLPSFPTWLPKDTPSHFPSFPHWPSKDTPRHFPIFPTGFQGSPSLLLIILHCLPRYTIATVPIIPHPLGFQGYTSHPLPIIPHWLPRIHLATSHHSPLASKDTSCHFPSFPTGFQGLPRRYFLIILPMFFKDTTLAHFPSPPSPLASKDTPRHFPSFPTGFQGYTSPLPIIPHWLPNGTTLRPLFPIIPHWSFAQKGYTSPFPSFPTGFQGFTPTSPWPTFPNWFPRIQPSPLFSSFPHCLPRIHLTTLPIMSTLASRIHLATFPHHSPLASKDTSCHFPSFPTGFQGYTSPLPIIPHWLPRIHLATSHHSPMASKDTPRQLAHHSPLSLPRNHLPLPIHSMWLPKKKDNFAHFHLSPLVQGYHLRPLPIISPTGFQELHLATSRSFPPRGFPKDLPPRHFPSFPTGFQGLQPPRHFPVIPHLDSKDTPSPTSSHSFPTGLPKDTPRHSIIPIGFQGLPHLGHYQSFPTGLPGYHLATYHHSPLAPRKPTRPLPIISPFASKDNLAHFPIPPFPHGFQGTTSTHFTIIPQLASKDNTPRHFSHSPLSSRINRPLPIPHSPMDSKEYNLAHFFPSFPTGLQGLPTRQLPIIPHRIQDTHLRHFPSFPTVFQGYTSPLPIIPHCLPRIHLATSHQPQLASKGYTSPLFPIITHWLPRITTSPHSHHSHCLPRITHLATFPFQFPQWSSKDTPRHFPSFPTGFQGYTSPLPIIPHWLPRIHLATSHHSPLSSKDTPRHFPSFPIGFQGYHLDQLPIIPPHWDSKDNTLQPTSHHSPTGFQGDTSPTYQSFPTVFQGYIRHFPSIAHLATSHHCPLASKDTPRHFPIFHTDAALFLASRSLTHIFSSNHHLLYLTQNEVAKQSFFAISHTII